MSLAELARLSETNSSTLFRIEKGTHKNPQIGTIDKIAEALRVRSQWLISGGPDGPAPDPEMDRKTIADGARYIQQSMVPFAVAQLLAEGRHRPVTDEEILALTRTMESNDYALGCDALEIELLTRRARHHNNDPEYVKAITDAYARQRAVRGERTVDIEKEPPPRAPAPNARKSTNKHH